MDKNFVVGTFFQCQSFLTVNERPLLWGLLRTIHANPLSTLYIYLICSPLYLSLLHFSSHFLLILFNIYFILYFIQFLLSAILKLNNFLQSSSFCILHLFSIYLKTRCYLKSVLLKNIIVSFFYKLVNYSKNTCVFNLWTSSYRLWKNSLKEVYTEFTLITISNVSRF